MRPTSPRETQEAARGLPNPKFGSGCGWRRPNFGIHENTSKPMFLVYFLALKFVQSVALNAANFKSSTPERQNHHSSALR